MPRSPDPWVLQPSGKTVHDADGYMVADCGAKTRQPLDMQQGNARLIALAPTLLALCEEMLPHLVATAEAYSEELDAPGPLDELMWRIERTIRRAKGD